MTKQILRNNAGFTFIEMALVLIVVGLLAGTGLLLVGKKVEAIQRKEALQKLEDARKGLLFYAANRGSAPLQNPTAQANDYWYIQTGIFPFDPWNQVVKYVVSQNIAKLNAGSPEIPQLDICRKLKSPQGYAGWGGGGWIDLDDTIDGEHYLAGAGAGTKIAALFISGGGKDIDGANGMLDGGSAGPNYVRKYPADDFDDLVVKVKADDLYLAIKDTSCTATVNVTDTRTEGGAYYVYNQATGQLLGSENQNQPVTVRAIFDTILDVKKSDGTLLKSVTVTANPTPISLP